jgi:hypothetical protein
MLTSLKPFTPPATRGPVSPPVRATPWSTSLSLLGRQCPKSFRTTGILRRHLGRLNVLGLLALWAFSHVELHGLPFLQAVKAASLNGREMHEDVLAILTADEAVAFGVVKPLYCSLFQLIFLVSIRISARCG